MICDKRRIAFGNFVVGRRGISRQSTLVKIACLLLIRYSDMTIKHALLSPQHSGRQRARHLSFGQAQLSEMSLACFRPPSKEAIRGRS